MENLYTPVKSERRSRVERAVFVRAPCTKVKVVAKANAGGETITRNTPKEKRSPLRRKARHEPNTDRKGSEGALRYLNCSRGILLLKDLPCLEGLH